MMQGPKKGSAIVYGQRCEIYICQKSKTVWVVDGEYNGKSFIGSGRTQSAAVAQWIRIAERSDD